MTTNGDLLREAVVQWEAELRSGTHGQDRTRTGTWEFSSLYKAVCCEMSAREWDRIYSPAAEDWRDRGVTYLTEGL